jgi:hypothetical protein
MTNNLEIVKLPEGIISFDHSTLHMKAVWNNGEEENWSAKGYSYEAKLQSFLLFTDQIERYNAVTA